MDNRHFITVGEAAEGMAQAIARKFSELSDPIMSDPQRAMSVRVHQVEVELELLQEVVGELMAQVKRLQELWKQQHA